MTSPTETFYPVSDKHAAIRDSLPMVFATRPPREIETPPPRAHAIAQGTVRVAPFAPTPDLLREFGVDPVPVLTDLGLSLDSFANADNTMSYATGVKLLEHCAEITRCDHFGLLVGQRDGPSALGLTGYLIMHSPTVAAALKQLEESLKLHRRGGTVQLATYEDHASITYTSHIEPARSSQVIFGALAILFNIMKKICGEAWLPTELLFRSPAPRDTRVFQRFFKAPVRFNAEQSMLVFPERWLGRAIPDADPTLLKLLQTVATNQRLQYPDDVIGDVRRTILERLSSGKVSIDLVADQLGIHPRTLNRRLKERDTSFIKLLTELRLEFATQLLTDSTLSITRIGLMVGYTSASSFTRSFERMTGFSPMNWRTRHHTPPAD